MRFNNPSSLIRLIKMIKSMCLQVFFEIFLFDFIPFVIFERIRIALFIYSKITLNVKNIFVFFFFNVYV